MKKRVTIQTICLLTGIFLLLAAAVLLIAWQVNIHTAERQARYCADTLQQLIPEPQDAVLEERRDNTMSVLSVDGTDFVGLLELPRYASVLPVGNEWGKTNRYPCRFGGSIYDGSMQIGGTTQKGQYDFYRELSVGDTVRYTDAEGNRYTFTITSLRYEKHADQAALQQKKAPLTLFIKNVYALEYLIVSCELSHKTE